MLPAESDSGHVRRQLELARPVWMPVNVLIIRALMQYHEYYGDDFTDRMSDGLGPADELCTRSPRNSPAGLTTIFLQGRRMAGGRFTAERCKFQEDPQWRDYLSFYEYFHGDNGAGLGASHQTGWTGVIARIMHLFATPAAAPDAGSKTAAGTAPARKGRSNVAHR